MPQVLSGDDGCPRWPEGVCGSITHSSSKAACVVANDNDWKNVGIDIEDILTMQTASELQGEVHSTKEARLLTSNGVKGNVAKTMIFPANESLFKEKRPRVGFFFGFECATVIDVDTRRYQLLLKISDTIVNACKTQCELVCKYELRSDSVITLVNI